MRDKPAALADVIRDEDRAMELLAGDQEIGLDLETGGLSPFRDPIAVVSMFGEQTGTTAVLHVRGHISDKLRGFLSRPEPLWTGHNVAQFDMLFLHTAGVKIFQARYYDTLIGEQSTLTTGRRDVRLKLQDTVQRRLGTKIAKGVSVDKETGAVTKNMATSTWMAEELSLEQLQYCVEDIFYLPKIRAAQLEKVSGTTQAQALEFEQRLMPIVARMTLNGLPLDAPAWEQWRRDLVIQTVEARRTIAEVLSPSLNINSSQQVRRIYKEKFDLDLDSADDETLSELAEYEGPIGASSSAIRLAKKASKRVGFYDDDWVLDHVHKGWVHARFWQTSTDTFRFSSSNPNLQQIPKDGRKIFGGVPGYKVVQCDYQQLEVRVAAAQAQDERLIAALDQTDIHKTSATFMFGVAFEDVTPEQRRVAKSATFSLLFGGGPEGLVRYAKKEGGNLTLEEAKIVIPKFFEAFPGIGAVKQRARNLSSSGRHVTITLPNGARRVLNPIMSKYGHGLMVPPSQILNTTVQGSAAIGMKYALFECEKAGLLPYLGATVHDELVGIVPDQEAEEYAEALSLAMVVGMQEICKGVRVGTEYKIGNHWS